MTATKGKIIWIGDIKQFTKGFGRGFKIDALKDEYLNMLNFKKDELIREFPFKVGDSVEVDYETSEEGYNKVHKVTSLEKTIPKIQTADTVEDIDAKIDKRILIMEKILERSLSTKWFEYFSDNKEIIWGIMKEISWDVDG